MYTSTPHNEDTILFIISDVATGLSFLGIFWLVYVFFKTSAGWTFSGKLIMCLTFSYFLFTLANFFIVFNSNNVVCQIEGFLRTFAILSSFYWAWKISRTAYFTITDEYFRPDPRTGWFFLFRGFIIPFLIALIPLIGFGQCSYGPLGRECALTGPTSEKALIWDICLITFPTAFGLAVITFYYIKIKEASDDLEDALKAYCDRFLVYPIGLSLLWLPSLAFRIVLYFGGYMLWLDITRVVLGYSLGFVHAMVCALQGIIIQVNKKKSFDTEMIGHSRATSEELTPTGHNRSIDSFAL